MDSFGSSQNMCFSLTIYAKIVCPCFLQYYSYVLGVPWLPLFLLVFILTNVISSFIKTQFVSVSHSHIYYYYIRMSPVRMKNTMLRGNKPGVAAMPL